MPKLGNIVLQSVSFINNVNTIYTNKCVIFNKVYTYLKNNIIVEHKCLRYIIIN